MLFADDIILINESLSEINYKLELWRHSLETKGFRLSKTKTKYMMCKFRKIKKNLRKFLR